MTDNNTDDEYSTMTLADMAAYVRKIDTAMTKMEEARAYIIGEIAKRTKDQLAAQLAAAGKTQGEVTAEIDGVKLTYSSKPKITWDSKKLQDLAGEMSWDKVQKIFSIKFSVKETTYKAIVDDALVAQLNEARTVEHTEPKISLA